MRVLMTADTAGGVGIFADELAAALTGQGHEVKVVVFSLAPPQPAPGVEHLWAPYRLEWMDDGGAAAELAAEIEAGRVFLQEVARAWKPEILHSNQFGYAGALDGIPTVLSVHSDVVSWWHAVRHRAPADDAYQRWYAALAGQALASAAAIVTPSEAARGDVLSHWPMAGAIEVIANGRQAEQFMGGAKQPIALTAGRLWDDAKQIGVLGALGGRTRLQVVIAGERQHPHTGTMAATPPGTRWLGALAAGELSAWMARAAVYIGTSVYEPFGLAVLEAALSGCALLLHDIATWRELWGPAAAFYATAQDLERLLERAAREPEWVAALGEAAARRARDRYTAGRMARAYERVYRRARQGE